MKKVSTKSSAALLFNNLSSNGKSVAYVHQSEAVLMPESAVTAASGTPTVSFVHPAVANVPVPLQQLRFVSPPDAPIELLVLASASAVFVYSADGKKLLHTVPMVAEAESNHFRGIAVCAPPVGGESFLFVGTYQGAVCRLPVTGGGGEATFGLYSFHKNMSDGVCDLSGSKGMLAVSSGGARRDANSIIVYDVAADGECGKYASFNSEDGGVCTSLRLYEQLLICAASSGHVRIYDLSLKQLVVAIAAHARWINALEIHPTTGTFATAAEDCFIGVWRISQAGGVKVKHVAHHLARDCMLTGVTFVGGISQVAATAYDVDGVLTFPTGLA